MRIWKLTCVVVLMGAACHSGARAPADEHEPAPATKPVVEPPGADEQPPAPESDDDVSPAPAKPRQEASCALHLASLSDLRRKGRADIVLRGAGFDAQVEGGEAVCGAHHTKDATVGDKQVKAGDGLVFEACTPYGLLQIGTSERVAGPRKIGDRNAGDVGVFFSASGVRMLSGIDVPGDRVVIGPDLWSVDVAARLESGAGDRMTAKVRVDCSAG